MNPLPLWEVERGLSSGRARIRHVAPLITTPRGRKPHKYLPVLLQLAPPAIFFRVTRGDNLDGRCPHLEIPKPSVGNGSAPRRW